MKERPPKIGWTLSRDANRPALSGVTNESSWKFVLVRWVVVDDALRCGDSGTVTLPHCDAENVFTHDKHIRTAFKGGTGQGVTKLTETWMEVIRFDAFVRSCVLLGHC